ncbi:MAG: hypothetical protein ACI93T_004479, partial [Porticoccaceae bacterium]
FFAKKRKANEQQRVWPILSGSRRHRNVLQSAAVTMSRRPPYRMIQVPEL